MKENLESILNKQVTVIAKVSRYSLKYRPNSNRNSITVCLKDLIIDTGGIQYLADHCWYKVRGIFAKKDIPEGSIVKFTCIINWYKKANIINYGIRYLRNLEVISKGKGRKLYAFKLKLRKNNIKGKNI